MINRGGPAFVSRLQDSYRPHRRATWCAPSPWCATALACRRSIGEIDALDNKIDGQVQLDLYRPVGRLINLATAWFLKNGDDTPARRPHRGATRRAPGAASQRSRLSPPAIQERDQGAAWRLTAAGAPAELAARLALLELAELIPDIALVAGKAKADIVDAAKAFFAVTESFRISRIEDAARGISPSDYYDGMALSRAQDTIGAARRGIAIAALQRSAKAGDPVRRGWMPVATGSRDPRAPQALTEGGDITVSRLA